MNHSSKYWEIIRDNIYVDVTVLELAHDFARILIRGNIGQVNLPIAQKSYGPNECKQGYVWREADEWDYVCVQYAIR
jgi:hypothetical protein